MTARAGRAGRPPAPQPLPAPVVDNHAHLDIRRPDADPAAFPAGASLDAEVAAMLDAAEAVGVDRVVHIGCDLDSARLACRLVDEHPRLLGGVALHPNEAPRRAAAGDLDAALTEIERLARHPRVRVVGETGLDYFRTGPDGRGAQEDSFRWHIGLAKRTGKALQIHDRDAHEDVLRILAEEGAPERTVLHCFSGDAAMARECLDRGYVLSFAGTVTFAGAHALREALALVPLDRVLVETDAPYLTPAPHRGAVNAPALVPLTVRAMAAVLDVPTDALCAALSENAERLYGPW